MDYILALIIFLFGIHIGLNYEEQELPPVELKQTYLIDGELYKPVNVLNCIHLQTSRKSIHAWDLCRNPIHFNR